MIQIVEDRMSNIRQDGIPSWCVFAVNGLLTERGSYPPAGIGKSPFTELAARLGFIGRAVLCLLSRAGIEGTTPKTKTIAKRARGTKAYEFYFMDIVRYAEFGAVIDNVLNPMLTTDDKQLIAMNANLSPTSMYSGYDRSVFLSMTSGRNRGAKSETPSIVKPLQIPGIAIYQASVEGFEVDFSVFGKSIARLLRFAKIHKDCEIRIDMPNAKPEMRDAVIAMLGTLPSNCVLIEEKSDAGFESLYEVPVAGKDGRELPTITPARPALLNGWAVGSSRK